MQIVFRILATLVTTTLYVLVDIPIAIFTKESI